MLLGVGEIFVAAAAALSTQNFIITRKLLGSLGWRLLRASVTVALPAHPRRPSAPQALPSLAGYNSVASDLEWYAACLLSTWYKNGLFSNIPHCHHLDCVSARTHVQTANVWRTSRCDGRHMQTRSRTIGHTSDGRGPH